MKTGLGSQVNVLEHLAERGQQSVRANRDGYLPLPIYGGPGRIRLVAIHRGEGVSKKALHPVVPAVGSRLAPCHKRKGTGEHPAVCQRFSQCHSLVFATGCLNRHDDLILF